MAARFVLAVGLVGESATRVARGGAFWMVASWDWLDPAPWGSRGVAVTRQRSPLVTRAPGTAWVVRSDWGCPLRLHAYVMVTGSPSGSVAEACAINPVSRVGLEGSTVSPVRDGSRFPTVAVALDGVPVP